MEFTEIIPAALLSLYVGVSNIAFSDRICKAYRRWGVAEWLTEPSDCRAAGTVAIMFSVVLLVSPVLGS
jgi:hypothetical protein